MNVQPNLKDNPVAKQIVDELIKRKTKLDQFEKRKNKASLIVLLLSLVFALFGVSWGGHGMLGLPVSLNGFFGIFLAMLMGIGLFRMVHFNKKTEKADKEFEELREEFISRQEEFWQDDRNWKERHKVFTQLQHTHDINVFYR
ncbi:DUF2663 family protein [Alkalihalobacillus sp. FSL R5-0424]